MKNQNEQQPNFTNEEKIEMLGKNEKKSVGINKNDLREIENPSASGAFDDAYGSTSTDSSLTRGLKSSTNVTIAEIEVKPNGFNIADIRLSKDFENNDTVRKVLTHILVAKPPKHVFFRVLSEPSWSE